jgi:hypothetical protein
MPLMILPYFGAKPPELKITPVSVVAGQRALDPKEAVAVRISGPGWCDLFVHSRVRPFTVEGQGYDTTTLLISHADGHPGPIFVESGNPWPGVE